MAAEHVTPEAINFMAKFGARPDLPANGAGTVRDKLGLPWMTRRNLSPLRHQLHNFHRSAREGIATGISAADRARTIQGLRLRTTQGQRDLVSPGHVFFFRCGPRPTAFAHRP